MSENPRSYRKRLQHKAESVVVLPPVRKPTDDNRPLQDTTLLVLGPDLGVGTPYRLWATNLGGIGLHIDGEFGLIDWLERHTFVKAMVLIDDPRRDAQSAAALAAEIRLLRPDVPVILAADPEDEDTIEHADGWPSFAVDYRPFALTTFIRSVEIASLMARFDRETQPRTIAHLEGHAVPKSEGDPALDDYIGPRAGWWIIPVLLVGVIAWGMILLLLLPSLFVHPTLSATLP